MPSQNTSDIDGELLDALEASLHDCIGQANAKTSGELADELEIEDTEAQPKTREAVKVLMRERGLPLIGGNTGYYIPETQAPIDDAIESLQGRIAGIQERQQLLSDNWEAWTRAETDGGEQSSKSVFETIRDVVRNADDHPKQSEVIDTVATLTDADDDVVESELEKLKTNGFAYIVDGEVKLP